MIRVHVVEFGRSPYFKLRWKDPISGKKKHKATTIKTSEPKGKKEANRLAAQLEADLNEGRHFDGKNMLWETFCERYVNERQANASQAYLEKVDSVFNSVRTILNPKYLHELTSSRLSYYAAEMRNGKGNWVGKKGKRVERPRSPASVKSNMSALRTAIYWAEAMGFIAKAPVIKLNYKDTDRSKGRPIFREEFERMLAVAPKVAGSIAHEICRFMELAWLTGLRLHEAVLLSWDNTSSIHIDWSGQFPLMVFPAKLNKNRKDQTVPLTPDAVEWLRKTPVAERTGPVALVTNRSKKGVPATYKHVGRLVTKIGIRANVRVSAADDAIVRYAGAHDLRRSFGDRWSQKVMPNVLCILMRHASITTTQRFYLNKNSQVTAKILWDTQKGSGEGSVTRSVTQSGFDTVGDGV